MNMSEAETDFVYACHYRNSGEEVKTLNILNYNFLLQEGGF